MISDLLMKDHIKNALREDVGFGDITTNALVPKEKFATAYLKTRVDGILCGVEVVQKVFEMISDKTKISFSKQDGDKLKAGDVIAVIVAPARCILSGERVALNYIRQMSGIATETSKYIKAINNPDIKLADTRKTTPGFRIFEKYAVCVGGATPHRFNLSDCVLIKDNHIECVGSITNAVEIIKKQHSHAHKIEVECETIKQVKEAVNAGVDIIMLDNMSIELMKECIDYIDKRAIVEVSGNVTLETIADIAAIRPDVISTSSIHSGVKPLDIGLDM